MTEEKKTGQGPGPGPGSGQGPGPGSGQGPGHGSGDTGEPDAAADPSSAETLAATSETVRCDPDLTLPPEDVREYVLNRHLSGEQPGRYRIVDELGRGGIGRVLLAQDSQLGREVAIKELFLSPAAGTAPVRARGVSRDRTRTSAEVRFLDEARITGQLEHPGVVPVHELGERDDGTLYYTMKVVRGMDMGEAIKGKDLAGRMELLPNYLYLCHAVAYAHSRGVIHRDLKPANVMVGEFGETVILDWGLAKARGQADLKRELLTREVEALKESAGVETVAGVPMGTPAYMSPEQAGGEVDRIDERTDVYSLGAILYEILTGRPPHEGKTGLETLLAARAGNITPPHELEPAAPAELADIAVRALSADKDRRYPSARELAEDVRRFQAGGLVQAHHYSAWDLAWRWVRRRRAYVAAVLALLLIGLGAWWYRGWADQRRRARAEKKRRHAVASQVREILEKAARGKGLGLWFDVYTFKLISLKEPLVERAVIAALRHPRAHVRRLAARTLGGMHSKAAVKPLIARLKKGAENSEGVIIEIINALAVIGDCRALYPVLKARWRFGHRSALWKATVIAFQTIPMPPLPKTGVTTDMLMDRGRALYNRRKYRKAVDNYNRVIRMDPRLAKVYNNRGLAWWRLNRLKEALKDFSRALEINPGFIPSLNNRGIVRRYMGDHKGALEDFNKVARDKKLAVAGLNNRALVNQMAGDHAGAIADFEKAMELEPKNARLPHNIAFLYYQQGNFSRALSAMNQALGIQPRFIYGLTGKAEILLAKGNIPGCLEALQRAVELNPTEPEIFGIRGRVRLAQGKTAAAKADFSRALKLGTERGGALSFNAVYLHYTMGAFARAIEEIRESLKLADSTSMEWARRQIVLAALLVRLGRRTEAVRLLKKLKLFAPKRRMDRFALYLRGELAEEKILERTDKIARWRCETEFIRGLKKELMGNPREAVGHYKKAVATRQMMYSFYALAKANLKVLTAAATNGETTVPLPARKPN